MAGLNIGSNVKYHLASERCPIQPVHKWGSKTLVNWTWALVMPRFWSIYHPNVISLLNGWLKSCFGSGLTLDFFLASWNWALLLLGSARPHLWQCIQHKNKSDFSASLTLVKEINWLNAYHSETCAQKSSLPKVDHWLQCLESKHKQV